MLERSVDFSTVLHCSQYYTTSVLMQYNAVQYSICWQVPPLFRAACSKTLSRKDESPCMDAATVLSAAVDDMGPKVQVSKQGREEMSPADLT